MGYVLPIQSLNLINMKAPLSNARHFWSGLILSLCIVLSASAQLVNDGQTVFVSQGSTLSTKDLYNRNGGTFANQGTLYISGNWIDSSSYQGSGIVELTGQTQLIRYTDPRPMFIGTLKAGNGSKYLETDMIIRQQLQLDRSIIYTQGRQLRIQKDASLTGYSSRAYIDGALYWAGTGVRIYPVGRNGVYAPLAFSAEPATAIEPVVGIELIDPPLSPVKPDTSLNRLSAVRYWQRTVTQGTSDRAYVTLPILSDEGIVSMDSVVVAGTNDLTKPFSSLGRGSVTGTYYDGTVTSLRYANTRFLAVAEPIRGEILYIPNAFAPASLNLEEKVFKIYGTTLSASGIQLDIYNRWGNLVYTSRSLEEIAVQGWSGQNRQTQQEEAGDVYTYVLQGKFTTGKFFKKTGTLTLLR